MHAAAVIDMSQDAVKNLGGRPPLSNEEPTVRVNFVAPESLRARAKRELGFGELAPVLRGLLEGYLDLPDDVRKSLDTQDKVRDFIMEAGLLKTAS